VLDMLFQRYGWDYDTYLAQPEHLIQELMEVIRAENDATTHANPRPHGFNSDVYDKLDERTTEELLQEASRAGLPMPGGFSRN
jgi:hypothetical protein